MLHISAVNTERDSAVGQVAEIGDMLCLRTFSNDWIPLFLNLERKVSVEKRYFN